MRKLLAFLAIFAMAGQAVAADPCAQYYNNGYCTDYVNSKIPKASKQRGNASQWRGGLPRKLVRRGDVAIFRGGLGHVAFVEDVTARDKNGNPKRIRISEMNYARGIMAGTPPSCGVTPGFGVRSDREIDVSTVSDFYGPTYHG
jgi:surface antigen